MTLSEESLARLEAIARDAGAAILRHYGAEQAVELKDDRSPLTAADRAAHEVIVRALMAWDGTIPIISEEGELPSFEHRREWRRFWLVDPLDGTKEFLQRNGEFTVNIALIEDGDPVAAAVYAPALDVMYSAARGLGSWKTAEGGARIRIFSTPRSAGTPAVVVESRSHPSAELEAYLRTFPVARRIRAGSSLKFCLLAESSADLYPRLGTTMEWDTAAGDCIYRNSGRDGARRSELRYNTPTLRNPHFVLGD